MKDLIKDTIEKIKIEHIAPEPKWKFLAKKYGVWVAFGLIVVFGAASFSVAYYSLVSLDWDLYRFMHANRIGYALSIFPYFWAVLFGVFLLAAFFDMRRTETGYRFSWLKISLITAVSIIALGIALSFVGVGGRVNTMMKNGVPYYGQHMMVTKETQWNNPQQGFLAGTIISISDKELALSDLSAKNWKVRLDEKALIRPRADIAKGQMIKIIGTQLDGDNFQANEIRPWMGGGMMGGAGGGPRGGMMNNGNLTPAGTVRGGGMMNRN